MIPKMRVIIPTRIPPYQAVMRTAPRRKRKGLVEPKIALVPKKRKTAAAQTAIARP
jgi:hypothetical protein